MREDPTRFYAKVVCYKYFTNINSRNEACGTVVRRVLNEFFSRLICAVLLVFLMFFGRQ